MPENEFEKKVSSEMQELRFKPSENVWLRVEERIKTKKKRRVFVIIFLLTGLALLGYWQRNNLFGGNENDIAAATEKEQVTNSRSSEETNNTSTVKPNSELIKKEEVENADDKVDNNKIKNDKVEDGSVADNKDISVSKTVISDPKKNKDANKVERESRKTEIDDETQASVVIVPADPKKKSTTDEIKVTDNPVVNANDDSIVKQDVIKQPVVKPLENITDSAKVQPVQQQKNTPGKTDTVLKNEQVKQPAKPIVKQDPSEKKWKWGLHITPGISSLSDHGFPISSQNSYNRFAYQSNVNSGSAVPPARQKPSDPKPGFAFQAGAFVQRQLSSRTSLSLGLQYGYYSNVLRIGTRRDSLLNNSQLASALDEKADVVYNAGGDTVKYTNRYHFIELPLNFQWQLNKNKAKPFVWSTGITIGQLVSTNAIMYDTAFNGIYYQNKKLLNKTQFSLSTGFSWTIANSKKAQWSLGPVVNFHLNRLVDNPFDNSGYMFFAGLRTAVLFNPKK